MSSESAVTSAPSEAAVPSIHVRRAGAVGTLILDNIAKLNAMSFDMWQQLPEKLQELDNDPAIRVIVLQGAGTKAFVSGSDISQFGERRNTPEGVALYNSTVDRAVTSVGQVGKPTIAHIHGYCFGGGLAVALHCDLRYASSNASFSIPAGKLGLAYNEVWLARLARLVGPANAKEIMLTSGRYDAQEAMRIGLINKVLDEDAVNKIIETIGSLAPLTHLASKIAIDAIDLPSDKHRAISQAAIKRCFDSKDYIEGRTAFTEKRAPQFNGV
jgi:enoyl-CoA hydratase